jgi:4-hydroxybenzoate polyprenyltransferase
MISAILAILFLPKLFLVMLAVYFLISNAYSLYSKKIAVLDVLFLAGLYAHRLLSGAVSTGDIVSAWLMGFSIFFFLSLALVKRYAELSDLDAVDKTAAHGRGYVVSDMPLIHTAGIASGYISVLVLALYINGNDVVALYRHPWMLWLLGPCFIYWITRLWLLAGRGQMHDDPIIFTFKDKASYITGLIVLSIIVCAI